MVRLYSKNHSWAARSQNDDRDGRYAQDAAGTGTYSISQHVAQRPIFSRHFSRQGKANVSTAIGQDARGIEQSDVAIEFTDGASAPDNITCCLENGLPVFGLY